MSITCKTVMLNFPPVKQYHVRCIGPDIAVYKLLPWAFARSRSRLA